MKVNYSNYKQISDDLENKILRGNFSPGQKISSIRILAAKYQVNANTVQRAIFKLKQTKLMISVNQHLYNYSCRIDSPVQKSKN